MVTVVPLVREVLNVPTGLTAFAGSLMLAYMALPKIISVAEDAIDAVPKDYRDGALALGATHWQTIWRVVLPAARSGVIIAVMLGIGRTIGETMAVMMITGNAARMPHEWDALFRPVRTMTATIAAEMGEVAQGSTHYQVLFAVGILLFVVTFLINAIASWVVIKGGPRKGGRLMG
jgi:phosphate transport system permease protein